MDRTKIYNKRIAFHDNYEAEIAEKRIAELEQKKSGGGTAVAASSSRSVQSLEKQIQSMDAKVKVAEQRLATAESEYRDWQKESKTIVPARAKSRKFAADPASIEKSPEREDPLASRLNALRQRETTAWEQHQRKLRGGWEADQQKDKQKRLPLDQTLAQRDKEVEEAKKKVAEAEAAMKKALAAAEEAKKKVPVITSVDKPNVEPEEIVTIYGENFITQDAQGKKAINFKQIFLVQGKTEKMVIANAGKNRGDEESVFFMAPKDASGSYSLKILSRSNETVTWNSPPITVAKKTPPLPVITGVSKNQVDVGESLTLYGKNLIAQDASGFTSMNFDKMFFVKDKAETRVTAISRGQGRGEEIGLNLSAPKEAGSYSIKIIAKTGEIVTWDNPLVAVIDKAAEELAKKKMLEEEAAKKKAEEELALKKKQEEELALRQAQDAAKKKAEEEELAKKKLLEEEAAKKKAAEELALKKKQEEELALKKKREEELAVKKKVEEEAARKKEQEELAARQREMEEAMRKKQEEEQWAPPPPPPEPEVEEPAAPPPEPEPEVVRQEPEPQKEAPPQCERGTWSPTLRICVEDQVPEEAAPPDCGAGMHWSPTLKSCQED